MRIITMAACAVVCGMAYAENFQSAPANKAQENYQSEIKRLNTLYEQALGKARTKYLNDLESARKTALIRNDLDEAQRIIEAKRSLGTEKSTTEATAEIPQWIVGTKWKSNEWIYEWTKNGIEASRGKLREKQPGVIIDENTAITIKVVQGKTFLRIWKFSRNQKSVEVQGFLENGPFWGAARIK